MGLTFSYALIDSEETEAIYQKMLADDAAKMLAWRDARSQRVHLPIDAAFSAWWFAHGPTSFATGADAVKYKQALLAEIVNTVNTTSPQVCL